VIPPNKELDKAKEAIYRLYESMDAQAIVVGIPPSKKKSKKESTHVVERILPSLIDSDVIPIIGQDEHLSTIIAYNSSRQSIQHPQKQYEHVLTTVDDKRDIDAKAAAIILQRAIDDIQRYSKDPSLWIEEKKYSGASQSTLDSKHAELKRRLVKKKKKRVIKNL